MVTVACRPSLVRSAMMVGRGHAEGDAAPLALVVGYRRQGRGEVRVECRALRREVVAQDAMRCRSRGGLGRRAHVRVRVRLVDLVLARDAVDGVVQGDRCVNA